MLVLTRRVGDSIVIADEIVVTVLEVRSDQVRLGIDAPREVAVHREEVYRQMHGMDASEPIGRTATAPRRMRDGGVDSPADSPPDDRSQEPDAGSAAGHEPSAMDGQRTSGSAPGYVNGRPRDAATAPSTDTTA